jgi:predicted RNase H-like HicB family nuclease
MGTMDLSFLDKIAPSDGIEVRGIAARIRRQDRGWFAWVPCLGFWGLGRSREEAIDQLGIAIDESIEIARRAQPGAQPAPQKGIKALRPGRRSRLLADWWFGRKTK